MSQKYKLTVSNHKCQKDNKKVNRTSELVCSKLLQPWGVAYFLILELIIAYSCID